MARVTPFPITAPLDLTNALKGAVQPTLGTIVLGACQLRTTSGTYITEHRDKKNQTTQPMSI